MTNRPLLIRELSSGTSIEAIYNRDEYVVNLHTRPRSLESFSFFFI
jgi:hypothetical protein